MLEILSAVILISAIIMSSLRRVNLLIRGFSVQSLAISLVCFTLGFKTGEVHYYIIGALTLLVKTLIIPIVASKSVRELKINREMKLIIDGYWSSILTALSIATTYVFLDNFNNDFVKAGFVLMVLGGIILIGRKKAISQMIGFLVMENGLVLFEISMIKMTLIIEILIILEVLMLSVIMGVMVFYINKAFDTVNTDYLSNIKE
ncbi:hydrogenase [Fervidicella metallireducens AeB]|uniref:Hydrogenase n=1 Tax=Fervidicella metallireducens AeB TaxID=1403537 RepID=A0A017RWA2_9CLOT|nr:hydrogenase [Fervidicella metallireducens]EYE88674.1 hydrogenase [Fervidicella metallireducens AeB]